jgi:hypothetical protein
MRLPFELPQSKFEQDARVKFSFTSPELHQNIEISLDGEETSVEALLDAFQRFLGALGISIPPNVFLGFVEAEEDDENLDVDDSEEDDK